jgi:transposase
LDAETGKKTYRRIHWGIVDENMKFVPGTRYIYASHEEKASLEFPVGWDLSELEKLSDNRKPGRPAYDEEDVNRLYGDIWLLEQIAGKTGIRQDLEKVFESKEMVNDIMTLAFFPYLTRYSFNRVARWQKIAKSPSRRELSPPTITYLTQSINESHRMNLLRLRAARLGEHEFCSVDSTTRSAYGNSLVDIKWGKNKEGLSLEQTVEVVVYTLDTHMPVYYRTFPGNMQDSRSLETILPDLNHAGFRNVVIVTDRGYEKIRNLEKYILQGQAMIMCTKVQQKHVLEKILAFGVFDTRPDGMEIDQDTRLYYQQYDLDYDVEGKGGTIKKPDRLKLNLYFDAVRRSEELMNLEIEIKIQREQLEAAKQEHAVMDDDATLKRVYSYFKIGYNETTRRLETYELNVSKAEKAKQASGFFAITTHKLDMPAIEVLQTYRLRDEQEKYFQQMKGQMGGNRQWNWSEEGKTGRLFIQFVALILSSYARHIWKSTELKGMFSSSLEVMDEMRPIRCIEHTGKAKFITPFIGKQIDICDAFGFEVPDGCSPDYMSKKKCAKRRGRPRKKEVERDL